MVRKPSTLIAATIKAGVYVDPNSKRPDFEYSQFMCHAIQKLVINGRAVPADLIDKTIELIENKLTTMSPISKCYETITLDTVLRDIGEFAEESDVTHKRRLQFWREFIKELKQQNQ